MSKTNKLSQIVFLSTEIGRGHPNYLDSIFRLIEKECSKKKVVSPFLNVFDQSKGLSKVGWNLVKRLYFLGGKGRLATKIYNFFRGKKKGLSKDSIFLKILGQNIKRSFEKFKGVCLVAHPLTATILSEVCRVWYLHGEISAPKECAIKGVEKIFVPLKETKDKLVTFGADPETIVITGLLIEPELIEDAQNSFYQRIERVKSKKNLTIGFFTSGAYPPRHIEKIILGTKSVIQKNMRAIIFLGANQRKYKKIEDEVKKLNIKFVGDEKNDLIENKNWELLLIKEKDRTSETKRAIDLMPYLDAFVSAPHERTNWAVGLGLPFFALFPLIGTFAPQNFEFAQKNGVVYPLKTKDDSKKLGDIILKLRDENKLLEMTKNGFGKYEINGAQKIISLLIQEMQKI